MRALVKTCTIVAISIFCGSGCLSKHADLLAMRKVSLEIREDPQIRVGHVRVYAKERGIVVTGELVFSGLTHSNAARITVTLLSPDGDVMAETHSPRLVFFENNHGVRIPKRAFSIPLHTRAGEGARVRVVVKSV